MQTVGVGGSRAVLGCRRWGLECTGWRLGRMGWRLGGAQAGDWCAPGGDWGAPVGTGDVHGAGYTQGADGGVQGRGCVEWECWVETGDAGWSRTDWGLGVHTRQRAAQGGDWGALVETSGVQRVGSGGTCGSEAFRAGHGPGVEKGGDWLRGRWEDGARTRAVRLRGAQDQAEALVLVAWV